MKILIFAASLLAASFSCAHAAPRLLSGFEPGFSGWQTMGDVSAQTAAVGLAPTQGPTSAFLTTMSAGENPFSGTPSSASYFAYQFLGLPASGGDWHNPLLDVLPPLNLAGPGGITWAEPVVGESGAMKLRFYVDAPSVISFDWDRIGRDADAAFFSLWADDSSGYRYNDWLWAHPDYALPFGASGVDLCLHTPQYCRDDFNINGETGWHSRNIVISSPGWYYLGFAMGEVAEGTAPSVLALDNLQIQALSEIPEPGTVLLVASALAGLGLTRKHRRSRQ